MYVGAESAVVCSECGVIVNRCYSNAQLRFTNRRFDYSYTYDCRAIVSKRFRDFCLDNELGGGMFEKLSAMEGFYHFQVEPSRAVNVCTTRFEFNVGPTCATCGETRYLCGAYPLFINRDSALDSGFHRTDLEFGDTKSRTACYLVCPSTKRLLESAKFKGLDFEAVYSSSTEYLGAGRVGS